VENLLTAWQEFLPGKRKRQDTAEFSLGLMDNILKLHQDLESREYKHGSYQAFKINDPKPRDIHKASVRDRLVHHAIYRVLYPYFDRKFIFDSYSCRIDKGTHRAMYRFRYFARKISRNNTRTIWILKCDIRKFFANIDHDILKSTLKKHVSDAGVIWLLEQIIGSFRTTGKVGVGLPLGNLTSQLLVNIYMNEFDQFTKRKLKTRYYIRYADDFVLLSEDKKYLQNLLPKISDFLDTKLRLALNPQKVFIKTLASGVDFLGWVHFTDHRVLRASTKRRMFRKTQENPSDETAQSYLGLLRHGDTFRLKMRYISIRNGILEDTGEFRPDDL
jgi:retron-type reverse transcriptase